MAIEKGSAGKSTRDLSDKRYNSRVVITLIGVSAIMLIVFFLPNLKGLGIAGLVVVFVLMKLIMGITDQETRRYRKLERRASKGAKGEEKVGDLLRQLPEGYSIFHDIVSPYGNIDHVVLNDKDQIFLIETKSHHGEVIYNGTNLLINFKMPEKDLIGQTLKNTYWLRDEAKKWTDTSVFIKPVIVFTNAFVKIPNPVKNISIVNKKYLNKVLTECSGSSGTSMKNPKAVSLSTVLESLQSKSEAAQ